MSDSVTKNGPWSVYFAGELFSFKHLVGNAALSDAIHRISEAHYHCILPQTLEQRGTTPIAIRNQDLKEVASCDLGFFHFDGPELDSGTVVEFLAAKFLDIPSVIIRSDFRMAGDGIEPWNLMASGFPRTKVLIVDSISYVQKALTKVPHDPRDPISLARASVEANLKAFERIGVEVVAAFDEVRAIPPLFSRADSEKMYELFATTVGGNFAEVLSQDALKTIARGKVSRGLL